MNVQAILKVLWKSIRDSLSRKTWNWIGGGSVTSLLSVFLIGKNFLDTTVLKSIIYSAVFLVILFLIRFFLFFGINSFKYLHSVYRDSKYGDAIIFLKEGYAKVHAYRKLEEKTDEAFKNVLTSLCDSVQKAFKGKNSCDCSVSIKVPIRGVLTGQASVMNLCRDREHSIRDSANYKAIDHTIIGNTAFIKVLNRVLRNNPEGFFYLNNNIQNTQDYDNTSKDLYDNGILPYNSEIVVPIIPIERDSSNTYEVLGFLCVDCTNKDKFEPKYDVPLIEGVVDGIYDIMKNRINSE